jgi:vacuolar-type H+-ATPase subunit F/Vma7
MKQIALIADKKTATCFKLAGLSNIYPVDYTEEAEKCLQAVFEQNDLKMVLVSERILNNIQIFEKIAEHQYPLIIPIPDLQGPKRLKIDLVAELIKRKTGIEMNI